MKKLEVTTLCKKDLDRYAKDFELKEYEVGIAIHMLIKEDNVRFIEILNMMKEIAKEEKEND